MCLCKRHEFLVWVLLHLFIGDKCFGLVESLGEFYPEAAYQRCAVHFYRNVWALVPSAKVRPVAAMLKAIHAGEDREAVRVNPGQLNASFRVVSVELDR